MMTEKETFDLVRVHYREMGGVVRGLDEEFENYKKKHKKTWQTDLPNLMPGLIREEKYREQLLIDKKFLPAMKNFMTWINGRWWTIDTTNNSKQTKKDVCFCGNAGTVRVMGEWFCCARHRLERIGW